MIKVGIIGITGYTGEELLKILSKHNQVKVNGLYGRENSSIRDIKDIYPNIENINQKVKPLNIKEISENCEIVFLCLPHTASFDIAPKLLELGIKVIDLSADFRIKNKQIYEDWYKVEHKAAQYIDKAVYGLSELNREAIQNASLIANPGCYPTSIILACAPAIDNGLVDLSNIIIDSKSGISGAGRKAAQEYFDKEHPNFRPYKIGGTHRHIPEIEQELSALSQKEVRITFTPQIIPVERGMLSSVYLDLKNKISTKEIVNIYSQFYKDKFFVKILKEGEMPSIKNVVNTNYCEIATVVDSRINKLIIYSSIDNLVKGASGQAVQNLNIMLNFDERLGLI